MADCIDFAEEFGLAELVVVSESRARLYQDVVWRRGSKRFSSKQQVTLEVDEVKRSFSNGCESVHLELSGYPHTTSPTGRPPSLDFRVEFSQHSWRHFVDSEHKQWRLIIGDKMDGSYQRFTFQVESKEKLAAWTAQFHQISTYSLSNELDRLFHVTLPKSYCQALNVSSVNTVVTIWSQSNCFLAALNPITMAGLQLWDIRRVQTFSVEFHPQICLRFNLQHANDPPVTQENVIELPSVRAAERLFSFFECLVRQELPRVYASLERREIRTSEGAKPRAILYGALDPGDLHGTLRRRNRSSNSSVDDIVDFDLFKIEEEKEDEYLTATFSAFTLIRRLLPSRPMELPESVLPPQVPPRDLIRPGVARCRSQNLHEFSL